MGMLANILRTFLFEVCNVRKRTWTASWACCTLRRARSLTHRCWKQRHWGSYRGHIKAHRSSDHSSTVRNYNVHTCKIVSEIGKHLLVLSTVPQKDIYTTNPHRMRNEEELVSRWWNIYSTKPERDQSITETWRWTLLMWNSNQPPRNHSGHLSNCNALPNTHNEFW